MVIGLAVKGQQHHKDKGNLACSSSRSVNAWKSPVIAGEKYLFARNRRKIARSF